ncbi:SRPBCC family protein [uncultured Pseudokineococcus sp.]|uniref:SRPBCC family protein n=1 Tax=uncultured Pseudokineococcus sp. TaxID=1642928 RepID=UPI002624096A|nr:SRPBCC family protein [uncultured Pseudokineococcus sp.]
MVVESPLGRVLRDADGVRLEFERTYEHPVEDVWAALTEPDGLARWIGTVTGDPRSGTVELVMSEDDGAAAEVVSVVECVPPSRLVVDLPSPDGPWRLSVVLRAEGRLAALVLTQRLDEPYDAGSIGPGWHYYLDRLGAVVGGRPVPADWDAYYPALEPHYAVPDAPRRG